MANVELNVSLKDVEPVKELIDRAVKVTDEWQAMSPWHRDKLEELVGVEFAEAVHQLFCTVYRSKLGRYE